MKDLTRKPAGYAHEAVWCDAGSMIVEGGE
jgi:hypothetical protein